MIKDKKPTQVHYLGNIKIVLPIWYNIRHNDIDKILDLEDNFKMLTGQELHMVTFVEDYNNEGKINHIRLVAKQEVN